MSNMTVRILFALAAIPAFIGLLYFGEISRKLLLAFLTIGASWEYARILETKFGKPSNKTLTPVLTALVISVWFCPYELISFQNVSIVLLPIFSLIYILKAFKSIEVERLFPWVALHIFGFLFFAYWFGSSFELMGVGQGFEPVLKFLFICMTMWVCDSGAYFVGVSIGKRKFAPKISPKKSWEGSIGGTVLTLLFGYFLGPAMTGLTEINVLCFCLIMAITAQVGDLFMSAFKRYAGVKDSSHLFPGHGGILDRFDSLFFAAPVAVIWFTSIGKLF
ncbi:MAG: phosphatidate cytidylyltransferase [Fibrobacterales bacterium]